MLVILKGQIIKINKPLSVPSSPIIIFMEAIICITTGGDMEEAYAALWELPLIWFIISCEIKLSSPSEQHNKRDKEIRTKLLPSFVNKNVCDLMSHIN